MVLMQMETKEIRENHRRPAEGQCRGHDKRSGALSRCRPWEQEAVTRFQSILNVGPAAILKR